MIGWIGQKTLRSVAMRVASLVAVSLSLICLALLRVPPALAVDCGELRSSCTAQCARIIDNNARLQACTNRCSLMVCPDIVQTCRAGDQTVCNNGFSSCNGACDALAAIPTAAALTNADACRSRCCTNFRACLSQRSCDVSGIVCR
jgi:hypothetical protein